MSADTTQLTNPEAITQRSLGKMVLFYIITFGIYGVYWYFQVLKELEAATNENYSPVTRFLLSFVIIGIWQMSQTAEAVVDQDGTILFILWLVFSPAAWYLISTGMNEAAGGAAGAR